MQIGRHHSVNRPNCSLLAALDRPCLQSFAVMPVLEGHAVVPHVHRLRTWLSAPVAAASLGMLPSGALPCGR
ncbi:hypothetical protein EE612_039400 [Oryza sativa]|nr:hypothetical protein EE612_039400 [Oryza sativa]